MAEPPTTTSWTPRSAHRPLHNEASLRLFTVGSCSAEMSASADFIVLASILSQPHRNVLLRQKPFHIAHGEFAEMKNARREDGIGFAFEQHSRHVLECACAAARHHGYAHRLADSARDHQVKPGLRAVGINAVQHDLAG